MVTKQGRWRTSAITEVGARILSAVAGVPTRSPCGASSEERSAIRCQGRTSPMIVDAEKVMSQVQVRGWWSLPFIILMGA